MATPFDTMNGWVWPSLNMRGLNSNTSQIRDESDEVPSGHFIGGQGLKNLLLTCGY